MVFIWIGFIWLILVTIWIIWKWKRKDFMTISKEGMKKYNDRMKMSIGESINRKKEEIKMKKLTILTIFVCIGLLVVLLIMFGYLFGTQAFAKLTDETLEIVEDLRMKHYGYNKYGGTLICTDDNFITWTPSPPIELIEIEINGMQFKGWEIWINGKPYYVVLLEKED